MLEEIGEPYRIRRYDIFAGEHLAPAFRGINPNHKLPAIVDEDPTDGGGPLTVFESGAVLIYLAEKSGRFLATEQRARTATLQWLAWQIAGLGPMLGQASHFVRYAPERHPYSINRYVNESRRLLNVMEFRLRQAEYLGGDYSIADMAAWPWIKTLGVLKMDLAEFPQVDRWTAAVGDRAAVARMFARPDTAMDPTYLQEERRLTPDEWSNTYGERMLEASRVTR